MNSDRITGLRQALELSPENHRLRLLLAEELERVGRNSEAIGEYARLFDAGNLPLTELTRVGVLAVENERMDFAMRCLDAAVNEDMPVSSLLGALNRDQDAVETSSGADDKEGIDEGEFADLMTTNVDRVTFEDVGGLESVKKIIHQMIILPFQRPELYEKYGRSAGGGVMLYGPPGCGKTLLSRATAGECRLPIFNVRIEDILDPFFGVSERNLHLVFERARRAAPSVIFIDELDAMAFARRQQGNNSGRNLVNILLQEIDFVGPLNEDLLFLGATNAPWDVDDALKRPGRFDRVIFVPPPDAEARKYILQSLVSGRPIDDLDLTGLAGATSLFSGADLRALIEQAFDLVIEEVLETGNERPLKMTHIRAVLSNMRPTTLDWLNRAKNYVEFANRSDFYKSVDEFLRTPEVRKWKI